MDKDKREREKKHTTERNGTKNTNNQIENGLQNLCSLIAHLYYLCTFRIIFISTMISSAYFHFPCTQSFNESKLMCTHRETLNKGIIFGRFRYGFFSYCTSCRLSFFLLLRGARALARERIRLQERTSKEPTIRYEAVVLLCLDLEKKK